MAHTPGVSELTFARAFADLVQETERMEAGRKIAWIKEHTFNCLKPDVIVKMTKNAGRPPDTSTNVTNMSDDFLDSFKPVFLIRHPAIMILSWHRAQKQTLREEVGDESFRVFCSLRWERVVFNPFLSRQGEAPLVLDSQRMVANPKALITKLCDKLDLDQIGAQFEWTPVPEEEQEQMDFMRRFFFRDLMTSGQIVSSKAVSFSQSSFDLIC